MMKVKNKKNVIRIKNLLWVNDLDVAKLARCIKKSRTWTSQVLYGHRKSEFTRKAIADVLGMQTTDLWPANGKNRRRAA